MLIVPPPKNPRLLSMGTTSKLASQATARLKIKGAAVSCINFYSLQLQLQPYALLQCCCNIWSLYGRIHNWPQRAVHRFDDTEAEIEAPSTQWRGLHWYTAQMRWKTTTVTEAHGTHNAKLMRGEYQVEPTDGHRCLYEGVIASA